MITINGNKKTCKKGKMTTRVLITLVQPSKDPVLCMSVPGNWRWCGTDLQLVWVSSHQEGSRLLHYSPRLSLCSDSRRNPLWCTGRSHSRGVWELGISRLEESQKWVWPARQPEPCILKEGNVDYSVRHDNMDMDDNNLALFSWPTESTVVNGLLILMYLSEWGVSMRSEEWSGSYLSILRTTSMFDDRINPPVLTIMRALHITFPAYHWENTIISNWCLID